MSERAEQSPLAVFQQHCANGELGYQVDEAGNAIYYPRLCVPATGSTDLSWKVSKGLGTVYATTTLFPRGAEPYDVSLIDVDEGFRMMARVENVDPMEVVIGLRVRMRMIDGSEAQPAYPVFEPLGDAQ
jgi:uncharacterized OB-fold protein